MQTISLGRVWFIIAMFSCAKEPGGVYRNATGEFVVVVEKQDGAKYSLKLPDRDAVLLVERSGRILGGSGPMGVPLSVEFTDDFSGGRFRFGMVSEDVSRLNAEDGKRVVAAVERKVKRREQGAEGRATITALVVAERAWYMEKESLSTNFEEIGFAPQPCKDGALASPVPPGWKAGCGFIYGFERGNGELVAVARGVTPPVDGVEFRARVALGWASDIWADSRAAVTLVRE